MEVWCGYHEITTPSTRLINLEYSEFDVLMTIFTYSSLLFFYFFMLSSSSLWPISTISPLYMRAFFPFKHWSYTCVTSYLLLFYHDLKQTTRHSTCVPDCYDKQPILLDLFFTANPSINALFLLLLGHQITKLSVYIFPFYNLYQMSTLTHKDAQWTNVWIYLSLPLRWQLLFFPKP